MNMNYRYSTTMHESIFGQMYIFLEDFFFCNFCLTSFHGKKQKNVIPEMHAFQPKYSVHTL